MPFLFPDSLRLMFWCAMCLVIAGLVLWMHGWGQRRPSPVAHLGTALMTCGGLAIGMLAVVLVIGLMVSSFTQAVEARTVTPRQEAPVH